MKRKEILEIASVIIFMVLIIDLIAILNINGFKPTITSMASYNSTIKPKALNTTSNPDNNQITNSSILDILNINHNDSKG